MASERAILATLSLYFLFMSGPSLSIIKQVRTYIFGLLQSIQFRSPYTRLLLKLEHVRVRGTLLHCVRCFLNDQEQRVIVDGQMSDRAQVASGVPQGSILGPLLFLIYMNDWY